MKRICLCLGLLLAVSPLSWGRDSWPRVEALPSGSMIYVTTDTVRLCAFRRADDQSLSCGAEVFARDTIQRICRGSDARESRIWGARIGALLGVALGAAVGAPAGWKTGAVVGGVMLPVGAAVGGFGAVLFAPVKHPVYVRPRQQP